MAVLCCTGPATAQPVDADPPGRVARLSEVIGLVWLYHPDNGDWVQADRNVPLTTGDRLATEAGARAELQIGSTTLRLDAGSDLDVAALDDSRISLRLQAGALALRVRDAAEAGPVEVLTAEGRFVLLRAGGYRVDRGSRSSFVGVESGQVRYEYAASALTVEAGQRGEFWIDANGAAQYALLAPVADAFSAWSQERDRAVDLAAAARFVSPEMTGAADLVRYGNWEQTPEYGAVWYPAAVAADWAPYSTGRWAWVRPWGWTWVDDAPWGFAPFHYGRWVHVRDRWCWTPGQRAPRPVYAPALVGWVGGGPQAGGSVSVGIGPAVGWFPLAPREVYVPSYRTSPRYARNLNLNVTNVGNIDRAFNDPRAPREFENRRIPRAVTVVPATVLTDRRPVGPAAAQYRDAPWAREFGPRGGGGFAASTVPPIAAPALAPRPADPRTLRPPPGFAERRGSDRGVPPERGADVGRTGGPPAPMPAPMGADPRTAGPDSRDRGGFRAAPADPRNARPGFGGGPPVQPAAAPPLPNAPQPAPLQPPTATEPGPTRGMPFRPPAEAAGRPAPGNGLEGRAPSIPPVGPRPSPTAEAQESPRMRALPVRRFDERRGGSDDAGRPEGAAAPAPRPQGVVPPPLAPTPTPPPAPIRPIEPQRPPERPVTVRPPEPLPAARPETLSPRPPEAQSPRRDAPRTPDVQAPRPAEGPRPAPAPEPRVAVPERRGGDSPSSR